MFVLGLTATPDRADGQSILEIFRECATDYESPRGCRARQACSDSWLPRVLTNVDLGRIRLNQIQYNRKDLEDTVIVPPRDRLIVETYLNHVPGRKAVAFCVNVRHGDDLAELFRRSGVAAHPFPVGCRELTEKNT